MRKVLLAVAVACLIAVCLRGSPEPPTFSNEVVRIFQQHCQTCHHPGDIGPFSLMDYTSARPWASRIAERVTNRSMPPWKPVPGIGDFKHARILSPAEIETIRLWAEAGAPEGDRSQLPPPLTFPDGWSLGQPDLVLSMEEYTPPAGDDHYRCFSLPTGLTEQRYISAVEIRPGNRSIVHHVLLFADPNNASKALDDAEAGQGYTCFGGPKFNPDGDFAEGWAPGARAAFFDPGTAMRLSAGGRLAMQIHYHNPVAGPTDRTQVGIYFASGPVDKLIRVLPVVNPFFRIPAGNPRYEVFGSNLPFFPYDPMHITAIAPHMHLLGREMDVRLVLSGGAQVGLIRIDDWDFEWQGTYDYRIPVAAPAGSRIDFTAIYDNSAGNPRNPNSPPKDVTWGEETIDEMALVFVRYTRDSEHLLATPYVRTEGFVNAASYSGGQTAPGAIVSLFGVGMASHWEPAATLPLPKSLAQGLKVMVNNVEAPLFYASPYQVNFQVPVEAAEGAATVTVVRAGDGARQSVTLNLAAVHPGIFSLTSDGRGPAAALHQDGSPVTTANPAGPGEWLSLFATGLGRVTPSAVSGEAPKSLSTTVNPVSVSLGGKSAEVNFAGLAPGFAGLYQVNFRVPPDAGSGAAVPLSLTISGVTSNSVTLAVK